MADFEDVKKIVKKEDEDDEDDDNDVAVTKKVEEEEKEEDSTLANTAVTTKYQEAAKIVQSSLLEIIALCVPGANIVDLCRAGDAFIEQKAALIYRNKNKGKAIEKGIAFPVCISINECVCHNSPLASEDSETLKEGDMLKIDMGSHVDGFIAVVAHTLVVASAPPAAPTTGPRADAMIAAYVAADLASKLIRPGNKNKQVSDAIKKVAEAYKVNLVAGTVMHQMKRFVIDGNKVIVLREEDNQKVEECTFEQYEVYAIDVAMTTGEGKPREQNARTTVFKRNVDKTYHLKMKASRTLYSEVAKRFPTLPFTLRALGDERGARMGVRECVNHELLAPYPVLFERAGDQIAHVKFTVLLLPSGTVKITGLPLNEGEFLNDDATLPEELRGLLAAQTTAAKKKKKKKAKKSGAGAAANAATAEDGDEDDGDEA